MVESIVDMHDCNVSTGSESRIHFVNYRSLEEIDCPVWGPRRLSDFEMILSLRGEFEFVNCETGEQVRQHPGEILTIRPGEEHVYRLIGDPAGAFFSCIHIDPGGGERKFRRDSSHSRPIRRCRSCSGAPTGSSIMPDGAGKRCSRRSAG